MSTVEKAISLLELFTAQEAEFGLSDLARRAGYDKATSRRLLVSLRNRGFVEQDAQTRRYRLGAGLLRLARIRELHFPLLRVASRVARDLAQQTGETVHLSEYAAGALATVHVEPSAKAHRVNVDVGQVLPLHGTASGIVFLAFSREELVRNYLNNPLASFTPFTVTDREKIIESVQTAARRGYSQSEQGYEEGVFSVAAPILGADSYAVGTLAVATPLSRIDTSVAQQHGQAVTDAVRESASGLTGEPVRARHAAIS